MAASRSAGAHIVRIRKTGNLFEPDGAAVQKGG
jgi:hypothetical protein